jgi:hypothetical protein
VAWAPTAGAIRADPARRRRVRRSGPAPETRVPASRAGVRAGRRLYIALVPHDLALLEPLRLPVQLFNLVFGTNFQSTLAKALQPALQILVNIGYPDVVPPDRGGTYNRTFTDNAPAAGTATGGAGATPVKTVVQPTISPVAGVVTGAAGVLDPTLKRPAHS